MLTWGIKRSSVSDFCRSLHGLAESARLSRGAARPEGVPRNWLVLGYAAVGDAIFFLPVLDALRRSFPESRITFLANPSPVSRELIPASGLVDAVEYAEWEGVGDSGLSRAELNARLAAKGFDGVLLSLSSPAHFFREVIAQAGTRIGHGTRLAAPESLAPPARSLWLAKRALVTGELSRRMLLNRKVWIGPGPENAVRRNMRLLDVLEGDAAPAARSVRLTLPIPPEARAFARSATAPLKKPLIGVHLGAPDNPYRKIWSAERFGRLCARLRGETGADFFLVGGPEEEPSVKTATAAAGFELASFVGRCRLVETFALIEHASVFLSNDTGLAKAAMALKVPTVTLWGPTDPVELGAWEDGNHLDVRLGVSCSPCVRLGMPHPKEGVDYRNCGHHRCLLEMDEEKVAEAVLERYTFLRNG